MDSALIYLHQIITNFADTHSTAAISTVAFGAFSVCWQSLVDWVLTRVTSRKSSSSLISEKAAVMLAWKSFQRKQNCSVAISDERRKSERLK